MECSIRQRKPRIRLSRRFTLYISFVKATGGSFEDENGNITVTSDPQNLVALEYIKSLYESGSIPEDCLIWEGGEDINGLATGQLAMAIFAAYLLFSLKIPKSINTQDNIDNTLYVLLSARHCSSFVKIAPFVFEKPSSSSSIPCFLKYDIISSPA